MKRTEVMKRVCEAAAVFGARVSRRGRVEVARSGEQARRVRGRAREVARRVDGEVWRSGRVCVVTGESGVGKSMALRCLARMARRRGDLVIEVRAASGRRCALEMMGLPLEMALGVLSRAGLAEVGAIFRRAGELSTGQQARLGMAAAFARVVRVRRGESERGRRRRVVIVADELCATLDEETTEAVWRGVVGFAAEMEGVAVVAATARLPRRLLHRVAQVGWAKMLEGVMVVEMEDA